MSSAAAEAYVEGLEEVAPGLYVRPMISVNEAIDLFLSDLGRQGRKDKTRQEYRRYLDKFADRFPRRWDVAKVTAEDCEAFLDLWNRRARGTQAQVYAPLAGLFRFLYRTRRMKHNPMEFVPTVSRDRSEDLDVVTVSSQDVLRLLELAKPGRERSAMAILAYLGPRRKAVALLRLSDYDRRAGEIRFKEKGGKTIWKPVPEELRTILDASIARGEIWDAPRDYLVPPGGPLVKKGDRDDRVIWEIVRAVARRAGVQAHVHALRGAFACFYLEQNPGDLYGLQQLLGHSSLETTRIYLRRFDKRLAMQSVRTLSWAAARPDNTPGFESAQTAAFWLEEGRGVGAGGFEPPSAEGEGVKRPHALPSDAVSPGGPQ